MPRRIPDYPDAYAGWNMVSSYGRMLSTLRAIFFCYLLYVTITRGERVNADPWNLGDTQYQIKD
jgi:cytochrome c oxidase subunit 1